MHKLKYINRLITLKTTFWMLMGLQTFNGEVAVAVAVTVAVAVDVVAATLTRMQLK